MPDPIYLDYNATTPVDPRVVEHMLPYFSTHFGNASSKSHSLGWFSEAAIEKARTSLAKLLSLPESSLVFTSGATEAINLGLRGLAVARTAIGKHIVTSSIEHSASFETCRVLEQYGFDISFVDPDRSGRMRVEDVLTAVKSNTSIVSIMWANNETGVINPIEELGRELKSLDHVAFLSDVTQMIGKGKIDTSNIDMIFASAHKFYGPKGVGLLSKSEKLTNLAVQITGGGQEGGLRGGTLNTPGIVGMGKAAELVQIEAESELDRLEKWRDYFEHALQADLPDILVHGQSTSRLPQTSNISFNGVRTDKLLRELRGIAASPGSACSSGSAEPSRVLTGMGVAREQALSAVRFSFGRFTSQSEVDSSIEQIIEGVRKSRKSTH